MKTKIIVVILLILLNVSMIANIYFLTRLEPPKKWCRDEVHHAFLDGNDNVILYNYLHEEINKSPKPIPSKFKFDDDGMGFTIWDIKTKENFHYKLLEAWNISSLEGKK